MCNTAKLKQIKNYNRNLLERYESGRRMQNSSGGCVYSSHAMSSFGGTSRSGASCSGTSSSGRIAGQCHS